MKTLTLDFESKFFFKGLVEFPQYSGTRVMMMPLLLGNMETIPEMLKHYKDFIYSLFKMTDPNHYGKVGYLTIDEKEVQGGKTHRRMGLHVDGVYNASCGGWGGDGGGWGSVSTGMLTVASAPGCKAYSQPFSGVIGKDGECDLIKDQCLEDSSKLFESNHVYWLSGLTVHESVPMERTIKRQFVRLSMPSKAPWFQGYTENPLGIKPTGSILPRREFMSIK